MTKKDLKKLQHLNDVAIKQINKVYSNHLHPIHDFSDRTSIIMFNAKIPHFIDTLNDIDARANKSIALTVKALRSKKLSDKETCLHTYSNDSDSTLESETMAEMNFDLKMVIKEYKTIRNQIKHLKMKPRTLVSVYGTTRLIHVITPETVKLVQNY